MDNILGDGVGSINLINSMGSDVDIVNAARVSFGKRKDLIDNDDEVLIDYLAKHNHTSPFEHVTFTFHIKCPLFVRSQWMRHRTWSYNEISRRYTTENIEFFVPNELRTQDTTDNLQGSSGVLSPDKNIRISNIIAYHSNAALDLYGKLLEQGVANEQARMVLPQNMYTEFYGTVNLHNLTHFIKLRSDSHAQQEIRAYSNAMVGLIQPVAPVALNALMKKRK